MSVTPLVSSRRPDALAEARVHLAAAYRLAVLDELEEGIDNHLTMKVPGQEGRYLILPFGWHWSEAKASNLVIYDDDGATVEGDGTVERSAHCIHTPIHRLVGAAVVLHTHQTWALALNSLQDNRLLPTTQTAAFFDGQIAYDDDYTGVAASLAEGERLARLMGDKPIVFMKNHGVLVTGDTVAQAYRRLYKLERVCRNQVLALSTGKPLEVLSQEIVTRVRTPNAEDTHSRGERERLYFEAMLRVLDRELPGFRD